MVELRKTLVIGSWEDAEKALARIAECQRMVTMNKASEEKEIAVSRARTLADNKPYQDEIGKHEKLLAAFVKEHKKDFEPLKSKELPSGVVGFELDKPGLKYPKDLSKVVEKLRALKMDEYIRVIEEPKKDILLAHRDRLPLSELGLEIKTQKDHFFYSLKEEKVG